MGNANEKQIGGSHYKSTHECWDYIVANDLGYLEGTAIKYLTRWKKKNGIEDLQKAIHFIQKLIEVETAKETPKLFKGSLADSSSFPQLDSFERAYAVSLDAPKRVVGRLRRTDDVAEQAWDAIPIYPGELNDITILRKDYVYD